MPKDALYRNIHSHSYEVMWAKCLAQGHEDKDLDGAGSEPPTLWL